ncbi:MAG TPA: DUF4105 domain-containing protein [Gemmatimonadales bacterium]|nr:DUF4105 domain-containing protein [Gemmatimonadales bacterium]
MTRLFRFRTIGGIVGAFLLCLTARTLPAQQPGQSLRIAVITIGPGAEVWERFGHNAIMVEDTASGEARWYNYGMFDFNAADFWPRFLKGDMRYWMAGGDVRSELGAYIERNRSVWIQELNLTPSQRLALKQFLEWNVLPENRFYHYDYYYDNCSTRVRDALDRVIGGSIKAQMEGKPSGTSFRAETRRLTESSLPVYIGIELGLGRPTDRPISQYEEMFLPMALRDHLGQVTLRDSTGAERPLVKAEETLYRSTAEPPPAQPPRWWPWFLLAGLIVGGVLLASGRALATSAAARWSFGVVAGAWALLAGLGGLMLAALWGFTHHTAAYANENLLQLCPLALVFLIALPGLLRRPHETHPVATRAALVLLLASLTGLVVKLLPGVSQMNWEIIAFALPVNAALALGVAGRKSQVLVYES